MTFSAGLAAEGYRPVVAIYSTFLQRAIDHTIHDVCLQNLPVVFCCDRGGLAGADGPTHHGVFDLTYLRMIPNMVVASPRDGNELRDLLWTAVRHTTSPFALRYPRENVPSSFDPKRPMQEIPIGSWELLEDGDRMVVIAVGTMVETALAIRKDLLAKGIKIAVVNGRFIKPLDAAMLRDLVLRFEAVVTIEENTLSGGFGDAVYEACQEAGTLPHLLRNIGLPDRFIEHGSRAELLEEVGLSTAAITQTLVAIHGELPCATAGLRRKTGSEGWLD